MFQRTTDIFSAPLFELKAGKDRQREMIKGFHLQHSKDGGTKDVCLVFNPHSDLLRPSWESLQPVSLGVSINTDIRYHRKRFTEGGKVQHENPARLFLQESRKEWAEFKNAKCNEMLVNTRTTWTQNWQKELAGRIIFFRKENEFKTSVSVLQTDCHTVKSKIWQTAIVTDVSVPCELLYKELWNLKPATDSTVLASCTTAFHKTRKIREKSKRIWRESASCLCVSLMNLCHPLLVVQCYWRHRCVCRLAPSHVLWVVVQTGDELFHCFALKADLIDCREQGKPAENEGKWPEDLKARHVGS